MPNVLNLFRSKTNIQGQQNLSSKKIAKKGPATIFRRKESSVFRSVGGSSSPNKLDTKATNDQPLVQNLTWTISQDEGDVSSTCNTDGMSVDLVSAVQDVDTPSDGQQVKEESHLFTFTQREMIDHQLNHIRALSQLHTEVAELRYITQEMAKKHAAEISKKDDEYVELLIKVRETEQQLKEMKGELGDVKEELGVVVVTLMDFQHKLFDATHKQDTGFWSSFSYF